MTTKDKAQNYELFEQALKNYEQALQAGLKLQQESAKWWTDLLAQSGSPQEWQARFNELASESMVAAQKRMEENLKLVEQSSRTGIDLLKQAVDATKVDSVSTGQAKLQELWEASLAALRANATAINQANTKLVESCIQFAPKVKTAAAPRAAAA
jgi:hypothetical protein